MSQDSSPDSGGIFSGIRNFVTREFNTFIATATGGHEGPKPRARKRHHSRVKSHLDGHTGPIRHSRRDRVLVSDDDHRHYAPSRKARSPSGTPLPSSSKHPADPRRRRGAAMYSPGEENSGYFEEVEELEEISGSERNASHEPVTHKHDPRRRLSTTMPGTFERLPSVEPHVHFAPENSPPRSSPPSSLTHALDADIRAQASSSSTARPPSTVRAAVRRFSNDGDPSILLPKTSPKKGKERVNEKPEYVSSTLDLEDDRSTQYHHFDKGKRRASIYDLSIESPDANTSGELRVRGKERELVHARQEQARKERERSVTVDPESAREHERDKEKIRLLEEEITRLKRELSRRPLQSSSFPPPPPPPPPPLPPPPNPGTLPRRAPTASSDFATARAHLKAAPPPTEAPINPPTRGRKGQPSVGISADKMAAFLTEMKTVRLRKVPRDTSATREIPSLTASNPVDRSFTFGRHQPQEASVISNRIASLYSSRGSTSARPSHPNNEDMQQTGEKRKRFDGASTSKETERASKRRSLEGAFPSCDTSNMASLSQRSPDLASFCQRSPSNCDPFSSSRQSSSAIDPPPSSQASRSTRAPTPSLSPDDDVLSPDERQLSTPPTSSHIPEYAALQLFSNSTRDKPIIDVDMEDEGGSSPPPQPSVPRLVHSDSFSRRPPASPLPAPSPRKPRPPARTQSSRVSVLMLPRRILVQPEAPQESDDEDPLSIRHSSTDIQPREQGRSLTPESPPRTTQSASQRKKKGGNSSSSRPAQGSSSEPGGAAAQRGQRRKTLQEEMNSVLSRRPQEIPDDDDLDSGVLIGVGTRSKRRGFLAHGGAGGPSVMMGEGYVEGVQAGNTSDEDAGGMEEDDDDEYQPHKRAQKTRSRAKRRS